jgi:methyl-accepting chemotaxis protein
MQEMRKSIHAMSIDINSMSNSFTQVARDVNSISHGVHGMSYDTRQMNRQMDTVTPPWSPFK